MNKIGLSLVLIVLCISSAQAYVLNIYAPDSLQAGAPLIVTGDTTFPTGTQFDMIFSRSQITQSEVARRLVIIDDTKVFTVPFETKGLEGGQYKVEAVLSPDLAAKLSSGSVTIRVVQLIDRSGEVHITSPLNQTLGEALVINAYIPGAGVTSIELSVIGPNGNVFGPRYISTTAQQGSTDGYISRSIAVTEPGNYYVEFSDAKGYIGTYKFTVSGATPPPTQPTTTETTGIPITMPGGGRVPLSVFAVIGALSVVGILYGSGLRRKK
jgi:hypothetical protein